jgi:hypothetical protein
MKFRSDSVFHQLTEVQKAQIFDWLQRFGYTETIKRVAAPEPDGFGLKTHRQSLHRFFQRYSKQLKAEHVAMALTSSKQQIAALRDGAEEALTHAAFRFANSPVDIRTFKELNRWITKHKMAYVRIADQHLALACECLALERARFEFNAAREALNHHAQLGQILADPHADDEAKIQAARERLFGKESVARIDAQENRNPKSE